MSDLDNRIRLDMPIVDFSLAGDTGQVHDEYPAPKTQARYDYMRTFLIGLLSNQSCDETVDGEPFQMRTGTLWFKKVAQLLTIFNGTKFDNLDKYIGVNLGQDSTNSDIIKNLQDFSREVSLNMQYVAPRVVWGGIIGYGNARTFAIPEKFQGYAAIANMVPYVHVNGVLIDPRNASIEVSSPSYIQINDNTIIKAGQRYFIILQHTTDIIQEDILAME
jgi:hypothetical protein